MWGRSALLSVLLGSALACDGSQTFELTRAELLDPDSCQGCHPIQHEQWASSMHAYAADDPVFIALNRRGQEETGGELGDFCVQCHAPMALREGATRDGLNLDELPQSLKGVTCYFCHASDTVEGTHNAPIRLADDGVLRAGISDPITDGAHAKGYSALLDSARPESSDLCGACHDVVTPAGVHLERTYLEFQESVFSKPFGAVSTTCASCHMLSEAGPVADVSGAPERRRHSHSFPGVDLAITEWPDRDEQRALIERDLASVLQARLCVNPAPGGVAVDVILDNVNAGHAFPSGASHDRRAWVRLEAFVGTERVFGSGVVDHGQSVEDVAQADPLLWQIRDFAKDANGDEVKTFWEVREVDSQLLPPAVTNDPADPAFIHSVTRSYSILGTPPDRIAMSVSIRPIGLDVIDSLVDSGHLSAELRAEIPTFVLQSTQLEWTNADGFGCVPF